MIHAGNCLGVMGEMEADSIDAVVTDPPYGLGFMGKDWDKPGMERRTRIQKNSILPAGGQAAMKWDAKGFQGWAMEWGHAALRVSKPGAYLLAFGGTRTFHRLTCAIEDAGWDIRDCLMWLYGQGFPKGKACLKPAWEPIIMARKPGRSTELNIDSCRLSVHPVADASQLRTMKRGRRAEDTSGQKWGLSKCHGDVPQVVRPEGRWPANVCMDEEAAAMLDEQSGVVEGRGAYVQPRPTTDAGGASWSKGDHVPFHIGDSGGASRFFYVAKASRKDRGEGNLHPTVKPTALMRWLCRLVTPPNGLILDPFTGSGSTGVAAVQEGFRFVGIELEPEYVKIAEARIAHAAGLFSTTP